MKKLFIALLCAIITLLIWRAFVQGRYTSRSVNSSRNRASTNEVVSRADSVGKQRSVPFRLTGYLEKSSETTVLYERLSDGFPTPYANEDELQQQLAHEEAKRQEALRADTQQSVNETVHHREAYLRDKSQSLRIGLHIDDVLALLGKPNMLHVRIRDPGIIGRTQVQSIGSVGTDQELFLTYSPNADGTFEDYNGISYQVLTILLDTNRAVARWTWETPIQYTFDAKGEFKKWVRQHSNSIVEPQ